MSIKTGADCQFHVKKLAKGGVSFVAVADGGYVPPGVGILPNVSAA
jgi:hypothetical protein